MRKLLSVIPPSESNLIRVDFRSTHVHYINDLEVDAMYKRWRSNLQEVHYVIFLRVLFLEGNSWSFFANIEVALSTTFQCGDLDLDASFPWTITIHP